MDFAESLSDLGYVEPIAGDQTDGLLLDDIAAETSVSDVDPTVTAADAELILGQYETGNYGNQFLGTSDPDGEVSFTFQSSGIDVTLYAAGFDIDTSTEVEVFVNDVSIGFMEKGPNAAQQDSSFEISADLLLDGENTVAFVQTGAPTVQWGVTDILVLGEALNVSALPIDPEFSDDGYVAWQTDQYFYLGMMHPDSGALVSIVHEVGIRPTDIRLTQQGPEIIRTSTDGIGAIGVCPYGLVHYTPTGAIILPDTVGLEVGYMPKGETPGLRFTAHDGNSNIFLYDNGTITALDFGGGIVTSWLNESEFLVSYRAAGLDQIGVYDLDTGVMTIVANETYGSPAHQAAFTASDGVQYLALEGDGYHEIWHNDGGGWQVLRQISSPIPNGDVLYSPEFIEWQGHVVIAGVAASGAAASDAVAAFYDIDTDTWMQPGAQQSIAAPIVDPEVMVLNGDNIAYYFSDISDPANFVEYFFTAKLEDVLAATLIDPTDLIQTGGGFAGASDAVPPSGLPGRSPASSFGEAWENWVAGAPFDGLEKAGAGVNPIAPGNTGAGQGPTYLTSLEFAFASTYKVPQANFTPDAWDVTDVAGAGASWSPSQAGTEADTFVFEARAADQSEASGAAIGSPADLEIVEQQSSAVEASEASGSEDAGGSEPLDPGTQNRSDEALLSHVIDGSRQQSPFEWLDLFTRNGTKVQA